jgi:protein-S-isoprenylcysteine O-methyltransferase Ste14
MSKVNSREPVEIDKNTDVQLNNFRDKPDCSVSDSISPDAAETGEIGPARTSRLVPLGNFFFKYRNIIFPLVFCALALSAKPRIIAGNRRLDMYLDIIGIVIASAGQLLRICIIGFAYIKRGGKQKKVYAKTLVQEGFFAHCRNPLYVGNVLVLIGLIIIHNSILMYTICLPFFLFLYWSITIAEENYLRGKFGQVYDDYTKRVPRFLISFKGLGHTLKGMQYDWKKVILKEHGTTFVFVTTVMALLVWERIAADGFKAASHYLHLMLILWGIAVSIYFAARIAKITGALGKS